MENISKFGVPTRSLNTFPMIERNYTGFMICAVFGAPAAQTQVWARGERELRTAQKVGIQLLKAVTLGSFILIIILKENC